MSKGTGFNRGCVPVLAQGMSRGSEDKPTSDGFAAERVLHDVQQLVSSLRIEKDNTENDINAVGPRVHKVHERHQAERVASPVGMSQDVRPVFATSGARSIMILPWVLSLTTGVVWKVLSKPRDRI